MKLKRLLLPVISLLLLNESCKTELPIEPPLEEIKNLSSFYPIGILDFDSYSNMNGIKFYWDIGFIDPFGPIPDIRLIKIFMSEAGPDNNFRLIYKSELDGEDSVFISNFKANKIYYFRLATYKSEDSILGVSYPLVTMLGSENSIIYSDPINQSEHPLYYSNLSWSPNGDKLSVVKDDNSGSSNLFLFDINTKIYEQITNYESGEYRLMSNSFSPDGSVIAYCYSSSQTFGSIDYRIWTVKTNDKTIKSITSGRVDADPIWLSNDSIIFCKGTHEPPNIPELYLANLHDENEIQLTNDQQIYKYTPSISTDREKIVISGYKNGKRFLYLSSLNNFNFAKISQYSYWEELHPNFSNHSKKIYFSSDRSGHFEIWSYDMNTYEYNQITYSSVRNVNNFYGRIDPMDRYLAVLELQTDYKFLFKILEANKIL